MPQYSVPGVYVEEIALPVNPIDGTSSSTAGFAGSAERGPREPQLLTGWSEFQTCFGGYHGENAYLARAVEGFFQNGGQRCHVARVTARRAAALQPADFDRPLAALAAIDEISILAVPEDVLFGTAVSDKIIRQCEKLRDRFAILSAPGGQADPARLKPPSASRYAACYYPWIRTPNHPLPLPATGHIAGIFARTDTTRGIHKAPADEPIRGAIALEFPVTPAIVDRLTPRGINCLRHFPRRGIRVWGARTLSADPEWKYINVHRLCAHLVESIEKGLHWAVFEPNAEPLWARVVLSVENFLHRRWRDGALQGQKPDDAFFVRCNRSTMTQADLAAGRLICQIGIAPLKPAEFIIFRIALNTADTAN